MRTKKHTSYTRYLFFFLAMLLPFLSGCIDDKDTFASTDELIKISFDAPVASRANEKEDNPQSSLENVVVLVFKEEEGKKDVFAYRALASEPKYKEGTTYEIGAYLTHSKEQEKYRLVLLGNPDKKYGNLHHLKGKDKETVLKELLFDAKGSETSYDWADKKALPLHGESDARIIHEHTSFNDIAMTRALAKVDITLNKDESVFTEYTLEEAWSYNSVNKGYIAQIGNQKESELPNLTGENYNQFIPFSNGIMLLAENKAGVADDIETTTCFVIGVSSKNKADDSSKDIRYYRVDLNDTEKGFLPILRNNHYSIIVDAITGDGADNKEDVLKGKEVDLKVTVETSEWKNEEVNYDLNGKRYFSLSSDHVRVPYPGLDVYLEYKTNYAEEDIAIQFAPENPKEFEIELDKEKKHIRIQALEEYSTEYKNDLTIQLGKVDKTVDIVVPIYYRKIPGNIEQGSDFDPTVTVRGKYVKMSFLGGSHYLECTNLPTDLTNLAKVGNRTFTHLTISAQSGNGYSFYKMISADELKLGTPIQIPGSGRPKEIKNPIDGYAGTIGSDSLNVVFELINVENPAIETLAYQTKKKVLVYNKKPIAEGLRILMIAGEFASPSVSKDKPNIDLSFKGLNYRVSWLLQQSKAFGLEDESFVFVTNFRFKDNTKSDPIDQTPGIKDNVIVWANSFEEWSKPTHLTDKDKTLANYDILIYLRSTAGAENEKYSELYNIMKESSSNSSLKTQITEFQQEKVFIQMPSKLKILGEGELYLDANATYLTGAPNVGKKTNVKVLNPETSVTGIVNNTFRKFSLGSNLDASPADGILTSPFDLRNQKVNTPQLGHQSSVKSNFTLHYLDTDNTEKKLFDEGLLYIYKSNPTWNDEDKPIIARNANYLWIGSPYIFDDSCMNLYRLALLPDTDKAKVNDGYASHFFINMIEWAAKKAMVNKKQLNGK